MFLYVIVCVGELGVVTVHICLSTSISFSHTLKHTHTHTSSVSICVHEHRVYTVCVRASLICVYVCTQARDFLFFFVYPGHIVWTGKMRMDGIVITEWRYPHSVKLEKAGRKPPTGTASKEREVVMVIGEFKQGFANLRGKRCECVRASCSCVCVCWVAVVIWGVYGFLLWTRRKKVAATLMKTRKMWCFQFFYIQTHSKLYLNWAWSVLLTQFRIWTGMQGTYYTYQKLTF